MKKTRKLILGCIIIAVAVGVLIYKYHWSNIDSNAYLSSSARGEKSFEVCDSNGQDKANSQKFNFKKFDGRWSLMKFTSNKGNKVNIIDNTKIEAGKFYIVVLDSKYKIVAKKNEARDKGNIKITIPKDGEYTIRIAGEKASGKFDISVNAKKNVDISHVDFWS
ncbi:hypothetical protein [Clostridium hydrogenum]|uniref:hypothetical protein n=1 Tax=Clostridium hydrogenum TaxID=2855764 RepID=UPI001F3E319B|nr:hypothetical protein [Clostridium hydrogenum]